jgi:hypothetical protein
MKLLALALLLSVASASDREFQGFHHFRNWDLNWASRTVFVPCLAGKAAIARDVCAGVLYPDPKHPCDQVCCGGDAYQSLNSSSVWDVYLASDTTAAPGAFCSVTAGGCNTPSQKYLSCGQDFGAGFEAHILNHYDIPPDLLHSECVKEPKCIGMRIQNDEGGGDLLCKSAKGGENPGYFKI